MKLTDFAGLKRGTLYLLGVLSALKAAALIGIALSISHGIVSVIAGNSRWHDAVVTGIALSVLRAAVAWAHRVVAARALLGAKERLRADLADAVVEQDGASTGSTTTLATHGLDELDKYFTVLLPALINAATLPLLIGAAILFSDWLSALVIVLTIPLIPVFMALIGMHTKERVVAATDALARLSDHLVELARGLPVLVGLGRAEEQLGALHEISERYRAKTVATLKTAFLSSLALELIATISVALVAVTIGVRLVGGTMTLEVGLFVLLLAPECFGPFRDVGAAFHASEEGREAARRVSAIIGRERQKALINHGLNDDPVRVQDLRVAFDDRARPVLAGLSFDAPARSITLLDGPSGSGKSTVLAALSGGLRHSVGGQQVSGRIFGVDANSIAWLPQHPRTVADTVLEELLLYGTQAQDTLDSPSASATAAAWSVLERLELAPLAQCDPGVLSPGELRRLAFGAVLMRVASGASLVLLDEPTAHLDAIRAKIVIDAIRELSARVTVIVASHDDAVRHIADHRIVVTSSVDDELPRDQHPDEDGPEFDSLGERSSAQTPHGQVDSHSELHQQSQLDSHTQPSALRELIAFLRPQRGKFIAATVLGVAASLSAIALTSLSAWLIVRASEQPSIMYLLVAIVGVRFFGIGRAVLRYSERVLSHDAVFAALTALRMRLWSGLAAEGTRNRAVLSGGSALGRLVRDADELRDLSIRVVQPMVVGVLTTVGVVIGLSIIQPAFLPLFLGLAVVGVIVAPAVALWADRAASSGQQALRSRVLARFAALVAAAAQLRANRVDGPVRSQLRELDRDATAKARRAALATGLGSALVIAACTITAVVLLPLSADALSRGQLSGELIAVLVLTPLGLIEVLLELVAAVQQWPALRMVLLSVSATVNNSPRRGGDADAPGSIELLELRDLAAQWPGQAQPVFEGLNGSARAGTWLVVTGASGSGKSTLLSVLLGHLEPQDGAYLLNELSASTLSVASLRTAVAWCPQEGHLFNSTLRANLLIARQRSDAPDEQDLISVLHRVGLGPLVDRLPLGLDTPIGAAGSFLSGGERQRVAVARTLLARSQVVLLDEPTAHLDGEGAAALIGDLRGALSGAIAVLVTHHPTAVHAEDAVIALGADSAASPVTVDLPTLK